MHGVKLNNKNEKLERAILMLEVAAKYIKENCSDVIIHYDEADCDGGCIAEDCKNCIDDLKSLEDK